MLLFPAPPSLAAPVTIVHNPQDNVVIRTETGRTLVLVLPSPRPGEDFEWTNENIGVLFARRAEQGETTRVTLVTNDAGMGRLVYRIKRRGRIVRQVRVPVLVYLGPTTRPLTIGDQKANLTARVGHRFAVQLTGVGAGELWRVPPYPASLWAISPAVIVPGGSGRSNFAKFWITPVRRGSGRLEFEHLFPGGITDLCTFGITIR